MPSSANDTPDSIFTYKPDGRLATEKYPHGRQLQFAYYPSGSGNEDRLAAIRTEGFGSPGQLTNIVSNIQYSAFGGVQGYWLGTMGGVVAVEDIQGDDGSTSPGGTTCSSLGRPGPGDLTGRVRGLFVSRSASFGGSGDIFKRLYRWDADQVTEEKTCMLDDVTPKNSFFHDSTGGKGYDQKLQLRHAARPAGEFWAQGGSWASQDYSYDAVGNRTSATFDGTAVFDNTISPRQRLTSTIYNRPQPTHFTSEFEYDADGRLITQHQWQSIDGFSQTLTLVPDDGQNGAAGAVYREVMVNGAAYEYYYDSAGRRRLKVYPTGTTDEFFYDGDKLIEDRGSATTLDVFGNSGAPMDEYVWLGGKPVAVLKSTFDSTWTRAPDRSGTCARNGEASACGIYFIVSDYLGKPVVMLDEAGLVTGVGEYQPFGQVNTVSGPAESNPLNVPYEPNLSVSLGWFNQPTPVNPGTSAQQAVRLRVRFGQLSTKVIDPGGGALAWFAWVDLADSVSGNLLLPPKEVCLFGTCTTVEPHLGGHNLGPFKTPWVDVPPAGVTVVFHSNLEPGVGQDGAVIDGYEYERHQVGSVPVWTALRFPGQYFDAETEFAENWNRFYDARSGRYLAPDPLLTHPRESEYPLVYSYGGNNPINYADPTGRDPHQLLDVWQAFNDSGAWPAAAAALAETAVVFTVAAEAGAVGAVLYTTGNYAQDCKGGCGEWAGATTTPMSGPKPENLIKHLDRHIERLGGVSFGPGGEPDPEDPDKDYVNGWKKEIRAAVNNLKQILKRMPNNKLKRTPIEEAIRRGEASVPP